ncbi:M16 family metallopeptidase [Sphingorhabdus arenilitoris]|uniref:M16 family metallopeptidase n=1 Tax=Sphingorhabdus arenilitoris TaxID=1490041 RepID=A0ABV8RHC5_9SPHN
MKFRLKRSSLFIVSAIALSVSMPVSQVLAQENTAAQTTPAAPMTVTPWGHQSIDIPADPAVRYGVLENGMKYALRKNETPKGTAVVRMKVAMGSVAEADNEQGLAHFLEHMAFNGSKNVPEGEMVKILERQGLSFGADTNAYTSFDETVYKLDLPKTDDKTVDTALFLMRETASNLTIAPEAVDRERGVVLSEMQFRNSPGLRQFKQQIKFEAPDTAFGTRLPIGAEEVLKTAPAERIRGLYERYYRPENTTLVIVGDFDVDAMEAKIKKDFADWQGVGEPGAPMEFGTVDPNRAFAISSFADPAVSSEVEMTILKPYAREDDSKAKYKTDFFKSVANSIMSRRFQKLALASDAKIRGGSVSFSDLYGVVDQISLAINAKEGDWKTGLMVGEQELRRALTYGFTQAELDETLANFDTYFKDQAEQADTRRNQQLADAIIGSVDKKTIITAPKDDLAIYMELRPAMTLDAINEFFKSAVSRPPNTLFITDKKAIENVQGEAMAVLAESMRVAVDAPEEVVTKAFAYDNFGKAGTIAADNMIDDLGIRTIRFANNVKLNLKKTDFEKGKVRFSLRFGNGQLSFPQDKGSLATFMQSMSATGALKEHDAVELRRILAGRNVSTGLSAGTDSFGTSGTTIADDLSMQMKILAAFVTQGGYRSEADGVWQNAVDGFAAQLDALPQNIARFTVPRMLANGDTRFGIGSAEELKARNIADVKAVLEPIAMTAPVEIAIVGDFDEDGAIKAVAESFGALPQRLASSEVDPAARAVSFTADRGVKTLYHKGAADQGLLLAYWPTTDDSDLKSEAIRDLTAEAMSLLLLDEIREKLGATYSPSASSFASDDFTGYGYISSFVIAAPDKMDVISKAVKEVTQQMRDAPVSDDVLLRARQPIMERFEKQLRENGFWLGLAGIAQGKPDRVERYRQQKALFEAVTTADIQAAAQQYLKDADNLEFRIVSDKTQSGTE